MRNRSTHVGGSAENVIHPDPPKRPCDPPKAAGLPERLEQLALAARLDAAGLTWCHVANEGRRGKLEAASLARQGVKPGVPDVLVFTAASGAPRGAAVELKRADGKPSDVSRAQRGWLEALAREGWQVVVAYGAADAVAKLRSWGYDL